MSEAPRRMVALVAGAATAAVAVTILALLFTRDPKPEQPSPAPPSLATAESDEPAPTGATETKTPSHASTTSSSSSEKPGDDSASESDEKGKPSGIARYRFMLTGSGKSGPLASTAVVFDRDYESWNEWQRNDHATRSGSKDVIRAATDADGQLALDGIPTGSYRVTFDDEFLFVASSAILMIGNEPPPKPIAVIVQRGGKITGRVSTTKGEPIAGAMVSLTFNPDRGMNVPSPNESSDLDEELEEPDEPSAFARYFAYAPMGLASARTDATGAFVLRGAQPQQKAVVAAGHADYAASSSEPIAVEIGRESDVGTIVLTPGGALVVHVKGPDGAPVAGARVSPDRIEPDVPSLGNFWRPSDGNEVDGDGTRRIPHLAPGKYSIRVESDQHPRPKGDEVEIVEGQTVERTITLEAGVALEGIVVDEAGKPIQGAQGHLGDGEQWRNFTTGPDGRFRAAGLSGRPLMGRVEATGFVTKDDLRLRPGVPDVRIVLERGGSIAGRVMTAAGEPVTQYQIQVWTTLGGAAALFGSPFGQRSSQSVEDPEGKFVVGGLDAGTFTLKVNVKGKGSGASSPIVLADAQAVEGVVISLVPNLTVKGHVLDATSRSPIAKALATWTDVPVPSSMNPLLAGAMMVAGGREERDVNADPDGSFTLTDVPSTALAITARRRGYLPGRVEPIPQPSADGVVEVEVLLARGGTVMGTVRDAASLPVPGAIVMIRSGFFPLDMSKSRSDGAYSISGIPSGSYTVGIAEDEDAGFGGALRDAVSVTIAEGETLRVDLGGSERTGCRIHGRVIVDDKPMPNVQLTLIGTSNRRLSALVNERSAKTSDAGEYEFLAVERGKYTLGGESGEATVFTNVEVADESELRVDLVAPKGALHVLVVDAKSGDPIPRMEVIVMPARAPAPSSLIDLVSGGIWQQTTGSEGRVEFRHLPAGTFDVTAGNESFNIGRRSSTYALERVEVSIPSAGATSIEIRLSPGVTLEGKVTSSDGRVVANPTVMLLDDAGRSASGLVSLPGEADGRYRIDGLKPGVYVARVGAGGFAPLRQSGVRVSATGTSRADFVLGPGGSVSLVVVDDDAAPVRGVSAEFTDSEGRPVTGGIDLTEMLAGSGEPAGSGETDESGRLLREHLAPGRYTITASDGRREATTTVEVREGATAEARIVLK